LSLLKNISTDATVAGIVKNILKLIRTFGNSDHMAATTAVVAASGPAIWTSTYGLEPVLCNRLLVAARGEIAREGCEISSLVEHMGLPPCLFS